MLSCWDNYWGLKYFSLKDQLAEKRFNVYNFLSFEDSFRYLIKNFALEGSDILMPGFYCEDTANAFVKNLNVHFCKINPKIFDIDYDDFLQKLKELKPKIILIYNFYGKSSILLKNTEWLSFLDDETLIISDLAHNLVSNSQIVFLKPHHFYIDSSRKCSQFMISHLITSKEYTFDKSLVSGFNLYKLKAKFLFTLKNIFLLFGRIFPNHYFLEQYIKYFLKHNHLIGSSSVPTSAFLSDAFLFKHLNTSKIRSHKKLLFECYLNELTKYDISQITLFELPEESHGDMNFFPIKVNTEYVDKILAYFYDLSIVVDRLWDLSKIDHLDKETIEWGDGIVVFPCTSFMELKDVKYMCKHLNIFFTNYPC